ncbi:MAG: class I SAM-dependent methyltransferase [Bacteroidetes bacterium]|nr:class I SAM-dependent methyltransferase [Bacteroidota bacterium]
MKFEEVLRIVADIPHMPPERGRLIYDFVLSQRPARILELGFAHGVSSCYMAAALDETGSGSVITMDNVISRQRDPDIHTLLERCGLSSYVTPVFAARSYTWELMKVLEEHTSDGVTTPVFDFVFIDGGHTWDSDGFSFLLADRLLKPGGWVLFDDMLWTPSVSEGEEWVEALPAEERDVAQIENVFNLLVVPHRDYDSFEFDGVWGWARKKPDAATLSADRSDVVRMMYEKSSSARRVFLIRRYLKRLIGKG